MNVEIEKLKGLISPVFDLNVLHEIFRRSTKSKQIKINQIIISDENLTKGYSYLSSVIKFTIEGTVEEGHGIENERKVKSAVFIKALPKNIGRRLSFRSTDFFRNETIFYNNVWSTLLKFQESKNLKKPFDNIPLCLTAFADGQNDFIALEDLSDQSYIHFKKQNEMDYESILFIIRLFARFHSLSFAFKDQFPKEFEQMANSIEETYLHEKFRDWYSGFQKNLITCSRDAIEKELPISYLEKFDTMINNDYYGYISKLCIDKTSKLSVINQGDAWIPNFLVKYGENNKLKDVKLIDFQIVRYCSPCCDLSLFLYVSASYQLLNERWDDIIEEYHLQFTKFLTELGSDPDIFTLDDLKADMKKNALIGITMSMEAIPFQMIDESEAPDLDTIQGVNAVPIQSIMIVKPIKEKAGRQKLANIFKHAIDKGFL